MQLLDHLKATDQTVAGFAAKHRIPFNTLRKIAYRQRQPSLDLAERIIAATEGAVTAADLILPAERAA